MQNLQPERVYPLPIRNVFAFDLRSEF